MTSNSDPKRDCLRHTLATLAYRGGNAVRDAPAGFAEFRGCESGRTAAQILAHIGDLLDWAVSIAQGKQSWNISDPLTHVGQIAMLRRMAGGPVKGENYFVADIVIGRVGPQQTPPKRQFD